jgi:hypothetical protein
MKLRSRWTVVAKEMGCANPHVFAGQLAVLINDACASNSMYEGNETPVLRARAAAASLATPSFITSQNVALEKHKEIRSLRTLSDSADAPACQ